MATNPSTVITQPGGQLIGLARQLVMNHLIDEATAIKAIEQSRKANIPFVTHLVENKLARDKDIARIASHSFNLPLFDLAALEIDAAVMAKSIPYGLDRNGALNEKDLQDRQQGWKDLKQVDQVLPLGDYVDNTIRQRALQKLGG